MTIHLAPAFGYRGAAKALAAAGLSASDVVHLAEYVPPGVDPSALADARDRLLAGHQAPVSTIAVAGLLGAEDAGYLVTVTAYPGGGTLSRAGDTVLRSADGVVYLPSVQTEHGEFRDQYRWCLERLGEVLFGVGLGLDALVLTTDYTGSATRADYPRCGRPRRELLGGAGVFPGAAGILVDHAVAPGVAVALDAIAATGPLHPVNPGWARYDTLTYGPGVLAGRHLFLSGFAALDPVSQLALYPDDLLAQARFSYDSIGTVLASAGGDGRDVTSIVEYVTPAHVDGYPAVAALRAERFPNAAVTSVVCSGLLRPEFGLEVVPRALLRARVGGRRG